MKKLFAILALLTLTSGAQAQVQKQKESFEAFKKNIRNRYENYCNAMLNRYADFLDVVWKDFEQKRPVERFRSPKPKERPVAKEPNPVKLIPMPKPVVETVPEVKKPIAPKPTPAPVPAPTPKPTPAKPVTPTVPAKPVTPTVPAKPEKPTKPEKKTKQKKQTLPEKPAKPTKPVTPTVPAVPKAPSVPVVPVTPVVPHPTEPIPNVAPTPAPDRTSKVSFDFYGLDIKLPKVEIPVNKIGEMGNGNAIKALNNSTFEAKALPALKKQIDEMQLPDYFVAELVRDYAKALIGDASIVARTNLMHYILLLCGFDIRPAYEVTTGTPILLFPFDQMVFARTFLELNGQKFFIFTPDLEKLNVKEARFRTPQFSSPMKELRNVDLVIRKPLNIKGEVHNYTLTQGGITVKGSVNERLMKMVYKYPQMPVPCYAQSVLDANTHREVEEQIKAQIGTEVNLGNVNRLLHFVQSAFAYATDDEQFGFEKPYFFEELLYYPKCDCEDRSVFYATLLRKVMGVNNHLINFPGHECVSVSLPKENILGSFYEQDGAQFYISDPTFIGANTGQCMQQYRNTAPRVEPW